LRAATAASCPHPKIEMSTGPGTVLPQLVHGGLALYMQRVALVGSRPVIQKLIGSSPLSRS